MKNYNYHKELVRLWELSVDAYGKDNKDASSWFNAEETSFLEALGISNQEMYDFAEDFCNHQDPDLSAFLLIQEVRRGYFTEVQNSQKSDKVIKPEDLPGREEEALGLVWLPRIRVKALGKLRGELDPDIMYSCGGDRAFLKEHDIHPAEFLRISWKYENDKDALFDWVKKNSRAATTA